MLFFIFNLIFSVFVLSGITNGEISHLNSVLLGPKNCGLGPSYWCKTFQNSVECSSVVHCTQTVWEVQDAQEDSTCEECNLLIENIRSAFRTNLPNAGNDLLQTLCLIIPSDRPMSCKKTKSDISDNVYFGQLKTIINSNTKPSKICSLFKLCNPGKLNIPSNQLHNVQAGQVQDVACSNENNQCRNFMTAVKCKSVSYCLQHSWKELRRTVDSPECSGCIYVIKEIRNLINQNSSKEDVAHALELLCQPIQIIMDYNACIYFVSTHTNDIMGFLFSTLQPVIICTLLDMCPIASNNGKVLIRSENIDLVLPDFRGEISEIEAAMEKEEIPPHQLLGANSCTWGPSYWCQNMTSAAQCKAMTHCIKFMWEVEEFIEDNDDVCKICKNMIQQARDTLQSNETQEELKEVFEGSCKLIPIKTVANECIKVVDDFVPELTEMLVSQMNPTAVCTVAGLCNNVVIDNLLTNDASLNEIDTYKKEKYPGQQMCKNCHMLIHIIDKKFRSSTKPDVLSRLLQICGELSSYSDICSSTIISNFNDIYGRLFTSFEPYKVCFLSGMCSYKYHFHEDDEPAMEDDKDIQALEDTIAASPADLPCDLCEQLVNHFRQILVANTTEDEFHQVLIGICKQSGKFQNECLNFVNANFEIVYQFLTHELNATAVCIDVGLCKRTGLYVTDGKEGSLNGRIIPLSLQNPYILNVGGKRDVVPETATIQDKSVHVKSDKPLCALCQYLMHYIQQELDDPSEEKDIEKIVGRVCQIIPSSMKNECDKFIHQYSSLIIAILAEEADPSLVCPELGVCAERKESSKISCPLCLLAIQNVINDIQDNKTRDSIKKALDHLCIRLPKTMSPECVQFVSTNYESLIDMIITDFTPQEVCVFLHLCKPYSVSDAFKGIYHSSSSSGNTETNEISTGSQDGNVQRIAKTATQVQNLQQTSVKPCFICESVMKNFEPSLKPNMTKDSMKKMLSLSCKNVKGPWEQQCIQFVDKYADKIYSLIQFMVNPQEVCTLLKLCSLKKQHTIMDNHCQFCEAVIGSLNGILADPYIDYEAVEYVDKACDMFPKEKNSVCLKIMNEITPALESIALQIPPWFICTKMKFCPYDIHGPLFTDIVGGDACTWGQTYWCQSKTTAAMCQAIEHCEMYVWKDGHVAQN